MEPKQSTSRVRKELTPLQDLKRRWYNYRRKLLPPAPPVRRKNEPSDVFQIRSIMHTLKIYKYEPAVISMVLDFCHKYVICVLEDAKIYSEHAGKKNIDVEDINLSITMQADKGFASGIPRDALMEIAKGKNMINDLPDMMDTCNLNLPADELCIVPPEPHPEYD